MTDETYIEVDAKQILGLELFDKVSKFSKLVGTSPYWEILGDYEAQLRWTRKVFINDKSLKKKWMKVCKKMAQGLHIIW